MAIVQALEECYGYTGKEGRPKKTTANAVVPPDEICTPEKTSPSGLVLCENEPASITQEEFASKLGVSLTQLKRLKSLSSLLPDLADATEEAQPHLRLGNLKRLLQVL